MTDLSTRTLSGDGVTQRDVEKPAFGDDLLERILDADSLRRAIGAAGIDGMSIDEFLDWAKAGHWKRVFGELETGCYQPSPVRRVEIDNPDGSKCPLGIPCVLDRIIQQAIAQVLTPQFDPDFSESSFRFRPRRSAKQAVKQVHSIIKAGSRIAVDVDLSKFFDRVNHDLLMSLLGRKIRDKRALRLIKRYLRAGVIDNQLYQESRDGVPQDGPLSPLSSNVMLAPLDKELERRSHQFARYADGLTILVSSQRAGERVLHSISQFLQNRLKLVVNTTKNRVVKAKDCQFPGFTFGSGRIQWHASSLRSFKREVRRSTNRNWGVSMRYQIFRLSQYLRGWINYFGIANCYNQCVELDHWIRRRLRMAYWRQWRLVRTKIGKLIKLGVAIPTAVACGRTSKGPCRRSKTLGIQQALSNAYLKAEGLFSLRQDWISLHHSV